MTKYILFSFCALLFFVNADCKDEPPTKDNGKNLPDTTSHNFTWQTFTWGGGGSSSINDVAILSDTDIWVVGDIQLSDSIAQDGSGHNFPFGAAHWDGIEWKLFRLPVFVSPTYTTYLIPTGIIAFSSTDIWFASGGVHRFNGTQVTESYWLADWPGNPQTPILSQEQRIEKLWGSSSNNIYAVGRSGAIAHYNGSSWQKLESGTTLDLHDIYGATNDKTGEQQILAVGSRNLPFDRVILRVQGTSVTTLSSDSIEYELSGVWFKPDQHYYVVGDGIFEKNTLNENTWKNKPLDITPYYTAGITGNDVNDVFVVGAYGECLHWNGVSWLSFREQTYVGNGGFGKVAMKENLVVAGGYDSQNAVLVMGKR
ncbi:MAG: glucosyl transferase [Bacteroidia bacterium]|nr:glucosyl transferase [Bacteroidia bacterium]